MRKQEISTTYTTWWRTCWKTSTRKTEEMDGVKMDVKKVACNVVIRIEASEDPVQ